MTISRRFFISICCEPHDDHHCTYGLRNCSQLAIEGEHCFAFAEDIVKDWDNLPLRCEACREAERRQNQPLEETDGKP